MINEHLEMVARLCKDPEDIDLTDSDVHKMHMCMGLAGEAGEVVDYIKKCVVNGHDMDREKILDECGDVMFYIAGLLAEEGYTISDALKYNTDKLNRRYPDGYSDKASQERADEND